MLWCFQYFSLYVELWWLVSTVLRYLWNLCDHDHYYFCCSHKPKLLRREDTSFKISFFILIKVIPTIPLGYIQRYLLMEIFNFQLLKFSATRNVWKLNITSTPWQSTVHILEDTTPVWSLLRYTKRKNPYGDHSIVYSSLLCWLLMYSQ